MRNRHNIDTNEMQKQSGGMLMENAILNSGGNVKIAEHEFPKLSLAATSSFSVKQQQSSYRGRV